MKKKPEIRDVYLSKESGNDFPLDKKNRPLICKEAGTKTTINITQKTITERLSENIKDFVFRHYCFFRTLINNRKMFGKVFWSNSDCYIEIGKNGYISNKKMYDLNGDITLLRELVLSEIKPLKLNFSEPEIMKIQKLAEKKNISIKELLLIAIDKYQQVDTIPTD